MDRSVAPPPVPFDLIDSIVRTRRLERDTYLKARQTIQDWHLYHIGKHEQITLPESDLATMKFIDHQLTAEDIEEANEWMSPDDPALSEGINTMMHDGYRLTFTYDIKNDCIVVTIIGKTADNINRDMAMSTRHGTVRMALHLALYKHIVVFQSGSWGDGTSQSMYG